LLINGHVQTILGSVARRSLPVREAAYLNAATTEDVQTPDGTTLRMRLNLQDQSAPLVALFHGCSAVIHPPMCFPPALKCSEQATPQQE